MKSGPKTGEWFYVKPSAENHYVGGWFRIRSKEQNDMTEVKELKKDTNGGAQWKPMHCGLDGDCAKWRESPGAACSNCVHNKLRFMNTTKEEPKKDMVNRPAHYTGNGMETIVALKGTMSDEEFRGFLKGNIMKYLTRAGKKDAVSQELNKVLWYGMALFLSSGGVFADIEATLEYFRNNPTFRGGEA